LRRHTRGFSRWRPCGRPCGDGFQSRATGLSDKCGMLKPKVLILVNGGVRSLVATAVALSQAEKAAVTLLHVSRSQAARAARLRCVRQQAAHFESCHLVEMMEPELAGSRSVGPDSPCTPLANMRLLTAAMVHAAAMEATRIVWPISYNGEFSEITKAMEQTVLIRHLASTELAVVPPVETPMIELTGRQIVELGVQLDVPWLVAWSCDEDGDRACGACAGCKRRSAAFAAAGVEDPSEEGVGVR
jgi:7-cyano-7-deazaguanine synthase